MQFVLLSATWGSSFVFIKVLDRHWPAVWVALGRVALGAVTLIVLVVLRGERLRVERGAWRHLAIASLLLNVVPFTLFAYGEQHVSSVVAGLWNASAPLWVLIVVMLAFPEEQPTPARTAGLAVGFVGVALLLGPWQGLGGGQALGHLACAGAAVCYGVGFPYARRYVAGGPESGVVLAAGQLLCATVLLAVVTPLVRAPTVHIGAGGIAAILVLGILGSGVAYVLNYAILRAAGATTASTVTYLIPVFSTLLGAPCSARPFAGTSPPGRSCCSRESRFRNAACALRVLLPGQLRRERRVLLPRDLQRIVEPPPRRAVYEPLGEHPGVKRYRDRPRCHDPPGAVGDPPFDRVDSDLERRHARERAAPGAQRPSRLGGKPAADHLGVELREVRNPDTRAARSELDPQHIAERLDARLRGAVGAKQRRVHGRGERRDRQGVAALVRDEGSRGPKRVVDAQQVDLDRALEDLRIAADERQLGGDAGVGDHYVQSAQVVRRGLHRCLHLLAVAHVARDCERVTALGRDLGEELGLDPGQHDLRAASVQTSRARRTDPPRRAGDQDPASGQLAERPRRSAVVHPVPRPHGPTLVLAQAPR